MTNSGVRGVYVYHNVTLEMRRIRGRVYLLIKASWGPVRANSVSCGPFVMYVDYTGDGWGHRQATGTV